MLKGEELKRFLDDKYDQYNRQSFIESDPIQIPHLFSEKEDIEIAGFLVATIAWGNRTMIIRKAKEMMQLMDHQPAEFIRNISEKELEKAAQFQYRTFKPEDFTFFIKSIQRIYNQYGGLESIYSNAEDIKQGHERLHKIFFETDHLTRTEKHLANVAKGSAAKRLNMFLRWMVRDDNRGVDFGIWKSIKTEQLFMPLDVHSGRVARSLGLLQRKQDDWKAVEELMVNLRKFDANDPVKYDFALFGLGVFEKF